MKIVFSASCAINPGTMNSDLPEGDPTEDPTAGLLAYISKTGLQLTGLLGFSSHRASIIFT